MNKLIVAFGTRPELIKIAPVYKQLLTVFGKNAVLLIQTGQHKDLIQTELDYFNIRPDYVLTYQRKTSQLSELISSMLNSYRLLFEGFREASISIRAIIGQGDTASTYATALQAFHNGIPFYHIEAGMRTGNMHSPFPEEFYRKSISMISDLHFVPTKTEMENLISEGEPKNKIHISGNTVIDNLVDIHPSSDKNKHVLITLHRRELDESLIKKYTVYFEQLVQNNQDWNFTQILHPNNRFNLSYLSEEHDNFNTVAPQSFSHILKLYKEMSLIYTDSGGIQEEAAFLKIPCIVCRENTERVQSVNAKIASLLDPGKLSISEILKDFRPGDLQESRKIYGDGNSSQRIVDVILKNGENNGNVEIPETC